MQEHLLRVCTAIAVVRHDLAARAHDERGEGIVSVAIAVLIMAALGVVAYGAFNGLFDSTVQQAETEIGNIGG